MHGVIFTFLKEFTEASPGVGNWGVFLESIQLGARVYLANGEYPDSEAVCILAALATARGEALQRTIGLFGEHMAPGLIRLYSALIRPE
jgi:hypothetical protein